MASKMPILLALLLVLMAAMAWWPTTAGTSPHWAPLAAASASHSTPGATHHHYRRLQQLLAPAEAAREQQAGTAVVAAVTTTLMPPLPAVCLSPSAPSATLAFTATPTAAQPQVTVTSVTVSPAALVACKAQVTSVTMTNATGPRLTIPVLCTHQPGQLAWPPAGFSVTLTCTFSAATGRTRGAPAPALGGLATAQLAQPSAMQEPVADAAAEAAAAAAALPPVSDPALVAAAAEPAPVLAAVPGPPPPQATAGNNEPVPAAITAATAAAPGLPKADDDDDGGVPVPAVGVQVLAAEAAAGVVPAPTSATAAVSISLLDLTGPASVSMTTYENQLTVHYTLVTTQAPTGLRFAAAMPGFLYCIVPTSTATATGTYDLTVVCGRNCSAPGGNFALTVTATGTPTNSSCVTSTASTAVVVTPATLTIVPGPLPLVPVCVADASTSATFRVSNTLPVSVALSLNPAPPVSCQVQPTSAPANTSNTLVTVTCGGPFKQAFNVILFASSTLGLQGGTCPLPTATSAVNPNCCTSGTTGVLVGTNSPVRATVCVPDPLTGLQACTRCALVSRLSGLTSAGAAYDLKTSDPHGMAVDPTGCGAVASLLPVGRTSVLCAAVGTRASQLTVSRVNTFVVGGTATRVFFAGCQASAVVANSTLTATKACSSNATTLRSTCGGPLGAAPRVTYYMNCPCSVVVWSLTESVQPPAFYAFATSVISLSTCPVDGGGGVQPAAAQLIMALPPPEGPPPAPAVAAAASAAQGA